MAESPLMYLLLGIVCVLLSQDRACSFSVSGPGRPKEKGNLDFCSGEVNMDN